MGRALVPCFINTTTFATRDFWPRRGASDAHTLQGSERSEQRRLGQKEPSPGGLPGAPWLPSTALKAFSALNGLRICSISGINKSECDELNKSGKVTMRQITSLVPARKLNVFSSSVSACDERFFPATSCRRYSRLVRGVICSERRTPVRPARVDNDGTPIWKSALRAPNFFQAVTIFHKGFSHNYSRPSNCRST